MKSGSAESRVVYAEYSEGGSGMFRDQVRVARVVSYAVLSWFERLDGGSARSWRRPLERARSRCQPGTTYVRKWPSEGMRATDRRTKPLLHLRVRIPKRDSAVEHGPVSSRIESIMHEIPSALELIA